MARFNPFKKVSGQYGAPMGRHGHDSAMWSGEGKLYARHCGGDGYYDRGGAYWGAQQRGCRLDPWRWFLCLRRSFKPRISNQDCSGIGGMTKNKHTTDVIFRRIKDGDLIALFPAEPGTRDPFTCASYMHVGQHGSASADLYDTKPAHGGDVLELVRELESLGYNLRICMRFTKAHHTARRDALCTDRG